jgi:hypothetical protein
MCCLFVMAAVSQRTPLLRNRASSGSHIAIAAANRQNLDGAAMALPNAGPAIKLERINAAAHSEFPKLKTAQPEPEGFENERTDA